MKLSAVLACTLSAVSLQTGSASNTRSLRGYDHQQSLSGGPFAKLKCLFEGRTNKDACATAVNDDGSPCSFCSTTAANGQEVGICVDPDVGAQMAASNDKFNCTNTDFELETTDFDKEEFKCEIEATTDAKKCATTVTAGEDSCQFCSVDGPFGTLGFCFSPDHADKLKGVVGDKMDCGSSDEEAAPSEDVEGPFSRFKCMIEGKTDKDTCASAVNDEGTPCSYCSVTSDDGQEAGLCVDPDVGAQMAAMNDQITCTNTDFELETTDFDKEEFKCEIEATTDAEKCATTVTAGEDSCQFCSVDGPFGTLGFCFSPDHADKLKGVVGDKMDCGPSDEEAAPSEDVEGPFSRFKCLIEGKTDKDACATAVNDDGSPCSYCSMTADNGQEVGLCVDPDIGAQMATRNDKITCTNTEPGLTSPLTGPISDCNIDGVDHDTCLDPSKVNGSQCIWCDGGIGGFCFPQGWESAATKFLSCEGPKEVEVNSEEGNLSIDPSFLSSNCFTVGLKGASPDDCRATMDDKTGDKCIFCSAPRLGGIGLCMTPEFKGEEGQLYTCDSDVGVATATE